MNKLGCTIFLIFALMVSNSNVFAKNNPQVENNPVLVNNSHDLEQDVLVSTAMKKGLKGPVKELRETEGTLWMASSITEHTQEKSHSFYDKKGMLLYEETNNEGAMYGTTYVHGFPTEFKIINTSINKSIFQSTNKYSCLGNIVTLQETSNNALPLRKHQYVLLNGKIAEHKIFGLSGQIYDTTKIIYDTTGKTVQITTNTLDNGNEVVGDERYSTDGQYRILERRVVNKWSNGREIISECTYFYNGDYNLIKTVRNTNVMGTPKQIVSEFTYSGFDQYGNWTAMAGTTTIDGKWYFPPDPITRVITYHK